MQKKFELTNETILVSGRKLFRIKALISFGTVSKGDLGGFVEKESNLSHNDNAWVYGDARVYGDAQVCGNARVCGNADYMYIKGLGSAFRVTTAFRNKLKGVSVKCGCFLGSLSEFKDKVQETHGDTKFAKEYLALIPLIEIHFGICEEE